MVNAKDIKLALVALVKQAIKQEYSKNSKIVKEHVDYANRLANADKPENYIRYIAKRIFPNENAYNNKIKYYQKYYKDNLLTRIEELYALYYELTQEEVKKVKKEITDLEVDTIANELFAFSIEDE